ncbi:Spy/CpxP family protein refolding chaperone [Paraburkholderia sp. Ac-20347]|jgi:periplasmic protein CpxP/Spy|uniref:Spy/CpxP family protein refolding chaperone n=1 Tax=Paraburkholderia sp. Ac-20347 TaxID=2703892 RepID=UPI00197E8F57|nr:Spy/CpxP family protein refolding chaperone [Paraburkholderia sp. Ac-20347]MBN3808910.1 Spy/CpxP family protein refolding chaperone [Paraburkholderia sp. Ac-20347]
MKKAFVILAATLSMSGAFAQTAASTPAAAAASGADVRAAQHQQRVEERIAYLHSALKITPEQEPQWKAFADTMRNNGETMATLYKQRADSETSRNALDDMKQYAQISQAHAEDMQKLVTAFEPLYTSLSPEQKKLADTTFRHRGPAPGAKGPAHGKHKGKPKSKAPAAAASGAEAASAPAAE